MNVRIPVTTVEELSALDPAEIRAGYFDGRAGEPEPGNNRSKAYWHGWRNGRVDGGHDEKDGAMAHLAREYVKRQRLH